MGMSRVVLAPWWRWPVWVSPVGDLESQLGKSRFSWLHPVACDLVSHSLCCFC